MARRMFCITLLLAALAVCTGTTASADVFTIEVPDLTGVNNLDFGQSFSSITSLKVVASGTRVKGTYVDEDYFPWDLYPEMVAEIWDTTPTYAYATELVDTLSISFNNKEAFFQKNGRDMLLDGKVKLWLDYQNDTRVYDLITKNATITYTSARLVVDGVPEVPEPSSIAALAFGMVGIGGLRLRGRK